MSRKEFPKAVKVAAIKRATIKMVVYCEECHAIAKRYQIDHIDPDGLTGKPTLENAKLLCLPCHSEKTKSDVANIAEAKRREAKHLGVKTATVKKIHGPQFAKTPPRPQLPIPPRKNVYTTI